AHACPAFFLGPRDLAASVVGLKDQGTFGVGPKDLSDSAVGPRSLGPLVQAPPVPLVQPLSPWLPVGTSADISCYSFYANKCITTGEGGMACTQNDEYAERMRIMSLHGISKDAWKRFTAEGSWYYEIIAPGFKYNLTDIASAIGLHQIRKANRLHQQRTERALLYTSGLEDIDELIL